MFILKRQLVLQEVLLDIIHFISKHISCSFIICTVWGIWKLHVNITINDSDLFYRRHDQYCKYVVKSFTWSTSPRNDLFHMEKHEVTQPWQKSHANTRCRRLNDVNGVFRICTTFCVWFFSQLNKDKYLFLRLLLLFLNQNKHTFFDGMVRKNRLN